MTFLRRTLVVTLLCTAPFIVPQSTVAQDKTKSLDAAREHFQRGRYGEAIEAYTAIAKDSPAKALLGVSQVFEAQGNYDDAEKVIVDILPQVPEKDADRPNLLARQAELLLLRGQTADCEKAVDAALKLSPDHPLAHLVQANLFAATGRIKEATDANVWFVRYYNRVQPENPETLILVARGAAQYARWNRATKIFDFIVNTLCPDALKADKNCWQASYVSGSLLLEKYNRDQGIPDFKQALSINPSAADVHAALAQDALQEHDLEQAAVHARRALEINPHHLEACLVLADLRLEDGRPTEALKALEPALQINPHEERTLARAAAAELLTDGLPSDDDLAAAFLRLESADKYQPEKPSKFITRLLGVARRNPHPGVFLSQVGQLMEARRKYDFAERCYRQAIASLPPLSEPKTALGMLYLRVGRNDEARKILDEAFKQDPFHYRVSNMIKVLKVLDTYDAVETEHFIIRVDSKLDRLFGRYAAEYLEEVYPGLVKQFGYEPPGKTQFEVYNKSKGLSGHEWFSARMIGLPWIQTVGASTGKIVALASPNEGTRSFNWARVLKHEFVHVLTLQQTNFNIPHWYTEALAVRNEGYARPPQWDELLLERVPKGNLFTLDNLNQGFIRPKSSDDWQFAYCQSLLYSQYMTETYGDKTISQLLECYRLNLPTADAIERTTGVDKETFEKGYRKYLEKIVADLRGTTKTEPEKSLAELEKAYLADKDQPEAAGRYAYELYKAGKRKPAREIAEKVHDKDPKNASAALVLAALALRSEDTETAAATLEAAVNRDDPNLELLETLGEIKYKAGDAAAALDLYELGLKFRPRSKELLKGFVIAAAKDGQRQKLQTSLRTIADLDPDEPLYAKKLADLAIEDQAWDEALKYARAALYVNVMDSATHVLLAKAWTGLNKPQKALDEWKVVVELKPDDADYQVGLARAEHAAGQKDVARSRMDKVLKKHPNNAEAKKFAEELK